VRPSLHDRPPQTPRFPQFPFPPSHKSQVHLNGYRGERCVDAVESNPRITQHLLSTPFSKADRRFFLLYAPLKVLFQLCALFYALFLGMPAPTAVLVQNPPSIPALLAVWLACRLRGSKFIVDWHNFGYTVLGLSMQGRRGRGLLVAVSRLYERFFARRADASLCVTAAMRAWLLEEWGVEATVLYDKAPLHFRQATTEEAHELLLRLAPQLRSDQEKAAAAAVAAGGQAAVSAAAASAAAAREALRSPAGTGGGGRRSPSLGRGPAVTTALTTRAPGSGAKATLRPDRPALIVSSTSWTEDEDFGILLAALQELDKAATEEPDSYPSFLVVVTGKGPQRAMYEERMRQLQMRRVSVRTAWLEASDYPLLLGSADLGVCLHFSTSGLDLPMKVVDMFGAGLPVCAVNFHCLNELVKHDVNGLVFSDSAGLAAQLKHLFRGFPGEPSARELARLRKGVKAFQSSRWQDNWQANAARHFG
jgi:beta-1,4-mannosyltransferase